MLAQQLAVKLTAAGSLRKGLHAVLYPELAVDVVDVVLHRAFDDLEASGDLGISHALGDEEEDLDLAGAEAAAVLEVAPLAAARVVEELDGGSGRDRCVAVHNATNVPDELVGQEVLEQVGIGAALECVQEV